jgi:hypothetical protein
VAQRQTTSEAMVADVVDLERYPLHDLESREGRRLVESCRAALRRDGACKLDGFLRPRAVERLAEEAAALVSEGFRNDAHNTVYFEDVDASLAEDDPRRLLQRSAQIAVAMDVLPPTFGVRRVYEWEGMTRFAAAALEEDVLYRSDDPLDGCNLTVYEEGDELGWHFDQSEFSITLMIQPAERGGVFEYVPMIRTDADENYEAVRAILQGARDGVRPFPSAAGTLAFFRGRYSLHRVTPVEGACPRVNSVLTYATEPGHRLNELAQRLYYGRVA